ncbi:hypothetical protein C8Q75DRAFT_734229 [Abortiporus biennis]|nr:hypothetical protein C8Q75DRAFT_734229 [Abortiporus biennis]
MQSNSNLANQMSGLSNTNPFALPFNNMQAAANMLGAQQTQQAWLDAVRLSVPVTPDDEETLLQALIAAEGKGESYKRAFDRLHGVNSHAFNLWRDYYLEHSFRLNKIIRKRKRTRPDSSADHPEVPAKTLSHSRDPIAQGRPKLERESNAHASTSSRKEGCKPRRSKHNARYSSAEASDSDGSRSPTPPNEVVERQPGRNKFTDADKRYFTAYLRHRYRQDINLSQTTICKELAEKAPHHSAPSWGRFWANNSDKVDAVYAHVCEEMDEAERKQEEKNRANDNGPGYTSEECQDSDESDADEDARNMSQRGETITDADRRVMARYIASVTDWDGMTSKERWDSFSDSYPQRTIGAWAEAYRRFRTDIDSLAEQYRTRNKRKESVYNQVGRPSWASKGKGSVVPRKRPSDYEGSSRKHHRRQDDRSD